MKVVVAVLGSLSLTLNSSCGLCGRNATLSSNPLAGIFLSPFPSLCHSFSFPGFVASTESEANSDLTEEDRLSRGQQDCKMATQQNGTRDRRTSE